MSREQDQRLVEAYERVAKGEPPLNEKLSGKNAKRVKEVAKELGKSEAEVLKMWKEKRPHHGGQMPHRYEDGECVYCGRPQKFNESRLDEAKKREFTRTLGSWFNTRLKNMKGSVKDLEDGITEKSPNAIRASLTGIKSIMTVMEHALENISEEMEYLVEQKWKSDPFGYKRELAERIKDVARFIEGIWISERYYPSDFEHDKKHKATIDKAFTALTKAVENLEKAMNQNKGI